MSAESIARALGGHKIGACWMARCPAHDDYDPSLSLADTADGKVLLHCHAGCDQHRVGLAIKSGGIWDEPRQARIRWVRSERALGSADVECAEKALRIWGATAPSEGKLPWTRFKLRTGAALRLLSACFSSRRNILSKNANVSEAVTLSFSSSSRIRESRVARTTTDADARLPKSLTGPQAG
jgi:hypothetical protein